MDDIADLAEQELVINEKVALEKVQRELRQSNPSVYCLCCRKEIAPARREAIPGVNNCIECQEIADTQIATKKRHYYEEPEVDPESEEASD